MYSISNYAFIFGIISILFVNRFLNFIARYVPPIVKNLICSLLKMINKKYFSLTVSILNIKCGANFLTENFAEKLSVQGLCLPVYKDVITRAMDRTDM